jgi:hypothetical protein
LRWKFGALHANSSWILHRLFCILDEIYTGDFNISFTAVGYTNNDDGIREVFFKNIN